MNEQTITIMCPEPGCRTLLGIKQTPGVEEKAITCPKCKKTRSFKEYIPVKLLKCPHCDSQITLLASAFKPGGSITCPKCKNSVPLGGEGGHKQVKEEDSGTLPTYMGLTEIGKIMQYEPARIFPLKLGINTIGRKADSSEATIQIETNDKKASRVHIQILVDRLKDGSYRHTLMNAKNLNKTLVSGKRIENGDKIILLGGETIQMAYTIIKFIGEESDDTN